jgi:uncharacterized protein
MEMKGLIDSLTAQFGTRRDYDSPPLHLWHPPLSGDIAICINAQGTWFHDGGKIKRESLVRLFASILRRETDGEYYLVTPGEKWRIEVEAHPLLVIDINAMEVADIPFLEATLNTGQRILVSEQYPLFLDPLLGDLAVLSLSHGLTALFTRAAWYRLMDVATVQDGIAVLRSGKFELSLPTT